MIVTDDQRDENVEAEVAETPEPEESPQYGVGPFTVREVALMGVWLVAFVISFFSINAESPFSILTGGSASVWTAGLEWVLTIGVPTVAMFLIVLRRFSPTGIRRVGSLGIDQFASVAFSVSTVVWLTWLWTNIGLAIETEVWRYSWVVWVEFFLMLAGVVLTVFAPIIPGLDEDFRGRPEIPAHRNARPVRRVSPRPARPSVPEDSEALPAAAGAAVAGQGGAYPAYAVSSDEDATLVDQSVVADSDSRTRAQTSDAFGPVGPVEPAPDQRVRQQAFWALAPDERDIVDESGIPIFRVGPTAWALVIEDRGEVFVVRHEDGRVGYLHDVRGVTRG